MKSMGSVRGLFVPPPKLTGPPLSVDVAPTSAVLAEASAGVGATAMPTFRNRMR